jgi:chaperonin GroES
VAKAKKKVAAKKSPVKKVAAKVKAKVKAVKAKATAKKATPAKKSVMPTLPKTSTKKSLDLKNFLTPLDDRLLVKLSEAERKTAGGLYIPDTVADVSGNLEGFVVAAGPGHKDKKGRLRPLDVQVGDRVIFSEYAGNKIELQGENVVLLREGDVMGIVNK